MFAGILNKTLMSKKSVRTSPLRKAALKAGFRSGLEMKAAGILTKLKIKWTFESLKLDYTIKSPVYKKMKCDKCGSNQMTIFKRYTPDFILEDLELILEIKGRFSAADRKKMSAVTKQNPDRDIIIVFQYPNTRLTKKRKKTNAMWCNEQGIRCMGIGDMEEYFTELLDYLNGYKR